MGQEDLERRVGSLEPQDRDDAEIGGEIRDFRQATTAGFNALREDFVELRGHVDRGFERVDRGLIEIRGTLDSPAAGQQRIAELIDQQDC